MTLANTTTTNDRYRGYSPAPSKQENNFEFPKPDEGVSALLDYEILLEGVHEDDSDTESEQIHDSDSLNISLYQLSKGLFAGIPWEARKELLPLHERDASPTTDVGWEQTYKFVVLRDMSERFDVIDQREDNWDGYESKSPNKLSLNNARQFMNEFVDAIISEGDMPLTPSLISSDEDGHITVEWHGEGRQLHLQIEEDEIDYIQVWGPNIDTEMHVDTLHSKDYLTLWKWLIYGK